MKRARVQGYKQLFARIDRRRGLHLRRWGPHVARQIDLLVTLKLVDWHYGGDHPKGSMHITLTPRGRRLSYKGNKNGRW